jgi:hypothetical protein
MNEDLGINIILGLLFILFLIGLAIITYETWPKKKRKK